MLAPCICFCRGFAEVASPGGMAYVVVIFFCRQAAVHMTILQHCTNAAAFSLLCMKAVLHCSLLSIERIPILPRCSSSTNGVSQTHLCCMLSSVLTWFAPACSAKEDFCSSSLCANSLLHHHAISSFLYEPNVLLLCAYMLDRYNTAMLAFQ